ncbi:MAG: 16S rRNA (guanine(527)-N(7))-methyltransferase RsmG [Pleurocapsa sp.]
MIHLDNKLPEMTEIWQKTLNWQPSDRQIQQFQQVYTGILAGNRQQNLTRITTPQDFWEKHLWDSLFGVLKVIHDSENLIPLDSDRPLKLIDIGTGAGFPGIPIAIAFPHWQITLLDSTRKKIAFLDTLISQLNLDNVRTAINRAEMLGQEKNQREAYDIAVVRAVSQPSVCAEYSLPLVKVGGLAILYRGHWSDEDTKKLQPAVTQLKSKVESINSGETPLTQGVRNCIYLRKISPTPAKFPRAVGTPDRLPL